MTKLEWRESTHGSLHGYAGPVRLFTSSYGLTRDERGPYVLQSSLPGYEQKQWRCADHEDAKARAERIWSTWLAAVGVRTEEATG